RRHIRHGDDRCAWVCQQLSYNFDRTARAALAPRHGRAMNRAPSIDVSDLTVSYGVGAASRPACEAITFSANRGEFIAIVGSSGCGKTTLLNAIAGFVKPSAGAVHVNGVRLTHPTAAVTMVFQSYALFPWMTVEKNLMFGLKMKGIRGAGAAATVG